MGKLEPSTLLRAADEILPSSSDEEDSAKEELYPSVADDHDKSKSRKRKKTKHGKDKKRKKQRSDKEKILDLEQRVSGGTVKGLGRGSGAVGNLGTDIFCYDTRGDMGNLVYEGLYAGDVARYNRLDPLRVLRRHVGDSEDQTRVDRYFHGKYFLRERSKHVKRLMLGEKMRHQQIRGKLSMPPPAFLPLQKLSEGVIGATQVSAEQDEEGETIEEYMLRRTKEFSTKTREDPYEEQLWLDYAAFQDECSKLLSRKGVDASVGEKKVAILQKGLEYHPHSRQILLELLRTFTSVADAVEAQDKWQGVLDKEGGAAELWWEYLQYRRSTFASFKLSELRAIFHSALRVLAAERSRRARGVQGVSSVGELEGHLVELTWELCWLELSAGWDERAVAMIQAVIEFQVYSPELPSGKLSTLLRLFDAFWESGAGCVGEARAEGWHHWFRREALGLEEEGEEEEDQVGSGQGTEDNDGGSGGWSGWFELPQPADATDGGPPGENVPEGLIQEGSLQGGGSGKESTHKGMAQVNDGGGGGEEEEEEEEEEKEEEEEGEIGEAAGEDVEEPDGGPGLTEEELLEQLGLQVDVTYEELQKEGVSEEMMKKWVEEEWRREGTTWQPQRPHHGRGSRGDLPEQEEVDPEAKVSWEDVAPCLFPLASETQKKDLVLGCLSLLGAPLGCWRCTNTLDPLQRWTLDDSLALTSQVTVGPRVTGLPAVQGLEGSGMRCISPLEGGLPPAVRVPWFLRSRSRRDFLAQLLGLLARGPLGEDPFIAGAWLLVEASATQEDCGEGDAGGVGELKFLTRAREAARTFLDHHRHHLVMWNAYAQLERKAGNIKIARKVYDMALASAAGGQPGTRGWMPYLVVQYVDMEMSCGGTNRLDRAHHIIQRVMSEKGYVPFKGVEVVDSAALRASRRALQDCMSGVLATAGGALDGPGAGVVVCAGLLEVLTGQLYEVAGSGVPAASAVFSQLVAGMPEDVRKRSRWHEALQVRHSGLLLDALQNLVGRGATPGGQLSPARVRQHILGALQLYPNSPHLMGMLVEVERAAHATTRLRRHFYDVCTRCPTPLKWWVAMLCEAARPGGAVHVPAVMERAVATSATSSCPSLWLLYMSYEAGRGRLDSSRRIFLRAVHECPWSKELWMKGLELLFSVMSPRERSDLLNVMGDKEVRIHTDMYEVLLETMQV